MRRKHTIASKDNQLITFKQSQQETAVKLQEKIEELRQQKTELENRLMGSKEEQQTLITTLKSSTRLKTLIKKELKDKFLY